MVFLDSLLKTLLGSILEYLDPYFPPLKLELKDFLYQIFYWIFLKRERSTCIDYYSRCYTWSHSKQSIKILEHNLN